MNRLEELIREKCPEQTRMMKLKDIATEIYRGNGIQRNDVTLDGIPCVRYGEIYTTYNIWFDKCVSHTKLKYVSSPRYFEHGDILFAITGETIEDIAKSIAYVGNEKCLAGSDIVVMKHNQNPKYLAYALSTYEAQKQKGKSKTKGKVVHSNVKSIENIEIPVPPLEVQQEIVSILDCFSEMKRELEQKLEREYDLRKTQYTYYRDLLLTPKSMQTVSNKKIEEICIISRGRVISKDDIKEHTGQYPVYSSQTEEDGVLGYIDTFDYEGEYVTWTTDGAKAGSVFHRLGKFSITNVCGLLQVKTTDVLPRYLFYALSVKAQQYVNKGMGNPKLMSNVMGRISIPVPPLEIQQRIVDVLDNFETICNDLSIGLPAEITSRKAQYEYYRDTLLNYAETGIYREEKRREEKRREEKRREEKRLYD